MRATGYWATGAGCWGVGRGLDTRCVSSPRFGRLLYCARGLCLASWSTKKPFFKAALGGYWEDGGAAVLLAAVGGPVGVRGRHVLAPILPPPSSKRCLRRRGAAYDRTTNSNLFIARPSPSSFRFPLHPRSPISALCATPSSKMHTANLE
jgi:hypothetical protein